MKHTWTVDELREALERFEAELRRAELRESSIKTYVGRTSTFLRWLKGEYRPSGPRR